jgi:hypothetical protein
MRWSHTDLYDHPYQNTQEFQHRIEVTMADFDHTGEAS